MNHHVLLDGYKFPEIGFGTSNMYGSQATRKIEQAISSGYRIIDSAFNYENEGVVGRAILNSSVPREEITVTSKLPGRHHDYEEALWTIEESVARTGLDYIDLYLIHWPNPSENKYVGAWKALVDAQKTGLIRSIGVSNFLPEHIDRLEEETGVLPVVNQIEMHPYYNQEKQREYHQSKGIVTQAWSPIGRASEVMNDSLFVQLAEKYSKSVAQIILRWHIQLGVVPIPKSGNAKRQLENISLFDFSLEQDDMAKINGLTKEDGRRKDQDPAVYQEF